MTVDAETRAKYIELKAKADAARAAAKPAEDAAREAMQPYFEITEQIYELLDGADVQTCEFCSKPIFEGDKHSPTVDGGPLCEECSPTYDDMLQNPENFQGADWEEMSKDEAIRICEAHVAAGGSLDDKIGVTA